MELQITTCVTLPFSFVNWQKKPIVFIHHLWNACTIVGTISLTAGTKMATITPAVITLRTKVRVSLLN